MFHCFPAASIHEGGVGERLGRQPVVRLAAGPRRLDEARVLERRQVLRAKVSEGRAEEYDRPVHGVIFASFRDFLIGEFRPEVAKAVVADRQPHAISETYPDEEFLDKVRDACEATGIEADELVHRFGAFAGRETFPRLYPEYYALAGAARPFLLTVEDRIHELVRATIPNATPPQLRVSALEDDGVRIDYSSPRKLCVLLRGLAEGTATHYGEECDIEEIACMRQGDPTCLFEIRFRAREPAA